MKILVIDDHALIRDAVAGVLKALQGDAVDIVEAVSAHRAREQLAKPVEFDMVLLDLGLPDCDGIEFLREIAARHPTTSVVVLSALDDHQRVRQTLELGALGFIPKSVSREVMISAFNLIFSGGVYIPPEILVGDIKLKAAPKLQPTAEAPLLTARQLDVLALMMQGLSNKGISRALNLAEPTVKIHVSAILKSLEVSNRTEAAIVARELGLINPGDAS